MITLLIGAFFGGPYESAYAEAVHSNQPLVVGVGCAPPAGKWGVVVVKSLEGYKAPCIVVSVPRGSDLLYRETLPPSATADDIRRAIPAPAPLPLRKFNPYVPNFESTIMRRLDTIQRANC